MLVEIDLLRSQEVYSRISDDLSRYIYENRVMYSVTGDERYIDNIVKTLPEYQTINSIEPAKDGAYIYGAGVYGTITKRIFNDKFIGYIDRDTSIKEKENLKVISIKEADKNKRVYITPKFHDKEIEKKLIESGFNKVNIINIGSMLQMMVKRQYFDLEELPHNENEVFVDVGAFDGDSVLGVKEWSINYKKIICLEPDKENISKLYSRIKKENISRVEVIEKGAWSSDEELRFVSDGAEASIGQNGSCIVKVCKLDDVLINEDVTYIKMDIEGAELEALKGAEKTIKRCRPKLAICVYHKPEDIFLLPQLILKFDPSYKFYFRHYTFRCADTVMYAI